MPSTPSSAKLAHRLSFDAIGTRWHIETTTQLSVKTTDAVLLCIQAFDKKWSRFRKDSAIYSLRSSPGKLSLDDDEYAMLKLYEQLYEASDGRISPLVGILLEAAGYDSEYSFTRHTTTMPVTAWHDTLELQPASLSVLAPITIDIGAAGKGLLIDRLVRILKATATTFTVDAGGDIYSYNHRERIGLEHPNDASRAIGVVQLRDRAICGSAPNRRQWQGTHHIVDARSGNATNSMCATWAIAETTMHADMASTALFFIPPNVLQQHINCHFITLNNDSTLRYSNDMDIEIYA